ncbi:RNA polymerase sigma-70 factor [Ohtaekwangia koreensis]|uniref:RNA polymerase sigma-70 factor, ECF subfamily n=1 Tax=Ohtaekwangia koreensis TaxID=688867 RepID=A0A1T5MGK3_9BACT|nr:RNA polymerase sigma-70 factor [Ohtaekwangia koreensis]SKC87064.1 RNA polymerase sigma-70 factor, ECF subfamily [Ohtaekwangia koreensis]
MNKPIPVTTIYSESASKFPGTSKDASDINLLMDRILQKNDYAAFQKLFTDMYPHLCVFCVKFVHVKEVAEELVSDVFYTIWKNREQITMTSPKAYLYTAVRNRAFDYLRKIKKTIWCDLDEITQLAAENIDSQELLIQQEFNSRVEKSVASLPRQCRLIFELSRDHGFKYKEIATKLNISIKTVETQMSRALKHLRGSLRAA